MQLMQRPQVVEPFLEVRSLSKAFGGVLAVNGLDLTIGSGEVVALVGENGAGKSTIIKMISGQYQPDSGEMFLRSQPLTLRGPIDARKAGIAVIHQELQLVPQMSVAENIVLGRWPKGRAGVDFDRLRHLAAEVLPTIGFQLSVDTLVEDLSTGQQQLVEIARALAFDSKLLILDEPTASLSQSEAEQLMGLILELKARGIGILYVSHRMEEVFRLADRIVVVRDGRLAGAARKEEINQQQVVALMVGDQRSLLVKRTHTPGEVFFRTRGLTRRGVFQDISVEIRRGEVVGFAGLIGAGRTDVARCIFGADQPDSGIIEMEGQAIRVASPRDAIARGIAMVPEDRKGQGLVLGASVKENMAMSAYDQISHAGWLDGRAENELVAGFVRKLGIRLPSADHPVETLSGGNQQKVVLSRWLATNPKLMILDEPTRGVDVGAKAEIHRVIDALVADGMGVLLISSEMAELVSMSDRVYVMRAGRIEVTLKGDEIQEERVMHYAAGAAMAH
jgi:ABC-type sugar transport system ATPase subunit